MFPFSSSGFTAKDGPKLVTVLHSKEKLPIPDEMWMKQRLQMFKDTEYHLYNLILEGEEENRFSVDFMQAIHSALDVIQASQESMKNPPAAIITTSRHSKLFSNGLKLEQAGKFGVNYMRSFANLLRRFLGDDVTESEQDVTVDGEVRLKKGVIIPTIACIQGHAFAGGCLLAMAHDYRVMRSDKGWICMNEIDMPAPMPPGLLALLRIKLAPNVLQRVMLQAYRFTGDEALQNGIIDDVGKDEQDAWQKSLAIAGKWAPKARAGSIYGQIKRECWAEPVQLLRQVPYGVTVMSKKAKL